MLSEREVHIVDIKKILSEKDFLILDGAMGTMLQKSGLKTGDIPELLNLTSPEIIENIHASYINSGADIVYANTFGANRYKLASSGHSVEEIIGTGVGIARSAVKKSQRKAFVALDIGPIGQLLEPTGTLTFEEAYDIFKEEVIAGKDADLIVLETMTDLYEIKAAVLAAKENSDKPIICTMTFEQNGRTFSGCLPSAMALTLEGLGVDAVGVNGSLGPRELLPIVKEICRYTSLPVAVKPNAGLPDPDTNLYDVTPLEFAESAAEFADVGVRILGG